MPGTLIQQINKLRTMSVGELRDEWFKLYGEATRSRNKQYLWRRLAWRVQELAYGGLSDRTKARLGELAPDKFRRARTPDAVPGLESTRPTSRKSRRDPRLPARGTLLTRQYHGQEIRVHVLDDGFEWDGQTFGSLSAIAKAVTGQHWNGRLFFGLTKRKR